MLISIDVKDLWCDIIEPISIPVEGYIDPSGGTKIQIIRTVGKIDLKEQGGLRYENLM